MPKRINSRVANNSALGKSNIHSNTGNAIGGNSYVNLINGVNNLAKIKLLKRVDDTYNKELSVEHTMLLTYNHIIVDNDVNNNSEIVKNFGFNNDETYDYLRPLPAQYLDYLYYDFILQYLNISPLDIGTVQQYNEIINYIDNVLNSVDVSNYNQIVLKVYRGALECLFKARRDYVDLTAINNEIQFIKKKYDKLNLLNMNILDDLKLFAGNNGIAYSSTNHMKPAIYMQALFDINLAWYQYIYKTSVINYDLLVPVKKYVQSFGTKKNAYNTLIDALNKTEMYTNHYNIDYTYDSWKINNYAMLNIADDLSANDSIFAGNTCINARDLLNDKLMYKLKQHLNKISDTSNNILDLEGSTYVYVNNIEKNEYFTDFSNIVPDIYKIIL